MILAASRIVSAGYAPHTMMNVSDIQAPSGGKDELVYMRVAADIEARIKSGELAPGVRLRSERDLAEFYGVAFHSVRHAIAILRERGLIETIHGRGNFVASEPPQQS